MTEWTVDAARSLFHPAGVYLNSATAGLIPDPAVTAMSTALEAGRLGTGDPADFDLPLEAARRDFARLAQVAPEMVAVGNQVSVFVAMVAAALPDGAEILVAEGEFTSVTFPFAAQQRFTLREVPLDELANQITGSTTLVAVSAVQSADGRVADLEALSQACKATDTWSLIDGTQAYGWFPLSAAEFDFTVCGAYKWLLCPRGTAFCTIRPEIAGRIKPIAAGWYAGADRWNSIYGLPLRLATTARRFDISPAWYCWAATAPAVGLLADIGVPELNAHAVGLANDFRSRLGMCQANSAIVAVDIEPGDRRISEAGIVAATRAGRLRVGFHLYNTSDDVDAVATALGA